MARTRKPKLGRRKPLPEEGPASFSQRVTITDDDWQVEVEVVLSLRRLEGPTRTGWFARSVSVRRLDGGPVTGRDLNRLPAKRYIDQAKAAVSLQGARKAEAAYARAADARLRNPDGSPGEPLGLVAPERLRHRRADLERRLTPEAKPERGRGMGFWIEFNREYAEIKARSGSPTRELARKHKVKPETIRVWRHRYGPGKGKQR